MPIEKPLAELTPDQTAVLDDSEELTFDFSEEEDIEDAIDVAEAIEDHNENIAEYLDDDTLDKISGDILDKVSADIESRSDWLRILKDALRLLGLKKENVSDPFEGACSATHPLLIESITKFQAKSYAELFPSQGPVKTKIVGTKTQERSQQSDRVKNFMNYEILELMPEYGPELDRGLFYVAMAGSGFKKTYFDQVLERPVSRFITAEDFIVPYHATDLDTCERYTHKIEMSSHELLEYQLSGMYRRVELGSPNSEAPDEVKQEHDTIEGKQPVNIDDIYTIYETHANYDIPGYEHLDENGEPSGLGLPYIFTIDRDTETVLAIRRNWKEEDPKQRKRQYFVHYQFIPGLGFYGYGYLHLVGSLAQTATSSLRQLIDAGTFANLPAGFKAHGMRVMGDNSPLQPGEFRDVQVPGPDLSKAIMPLPFREPSATLFNLLQFVVEAAEKFADSTEALISEAKSYGPVGTIMALLEQGGKLFSAIHKRLHYAQGRDFKILAELNYEWLPDQYPYETTGGANVALRADFDGRIDIIPVSDPNMPTQSHRVAKANAIFSIAIQAPQEHNMREVLRRLYEKLEEEEPEALLKPLPQQAQPLDLVTENQNVLMGQALKAGMEQNHPAHIMGHYSFAQMPSIQQNPQAASALMGHIQEHIAMEYRLRIQQALGVELPPPGQPIPPELENKIAMVAAQATKSMVEDEMMQQILNDPTAMVAMQGIEVEKQKAENDLLIDLAKLALEKDKLRVDDENADLDRESKERIARSKKSNA